MEIKEIISYYIHEKARTLEVSFTLISDSEDEVRNDIISISEAEDFGYKLIQDDFDIFEEEDFEFEDDEFESIDEDPWFLQPNFLIHHQLFSIFCWFRHNQILNNQDHIHYMVHEHNRNILLSKF
jgi:uncharacterized protein YdaT